MGEAIRGRQTAAGLGIALSIARRLVELHGGTVSAESPASDGARRSLCSRLVRASTRIQTSPWVEQHQAV
jgi:signal transduction histidine kinase